MKVSCFVLSSLSFFLSSKTNVVTNLNPFHSDSFFSLFKISESVSLSTSSESKKIKISKL